MYIAEQNINAAKLRKSNIGSLFITTSKSYKSISKNTVVQWIKTTIAAASIDVKLFTTHATRSTSSSNRKLHIPIEAILKTGCVCGGWVVCGAVCIHLQNLIIVNQ